MNRYFLDVSYTGDHYHGSQIQGNQPTIQKCVNEALSIILREEINSFGASRTDEGVHARQSFYHFDTEKELNAQFSYQLNAVLPPDISANAIWLAAHPEANARFDATFRSYRYRIYQKKNPFLNKRAFFYPYPLSLDKLNALAEKLLHQNDFTSFAKRNAQTKTHLCTITHAQWVVVEGEYHFTITANRFLRGMVRGLVGTQLHLSRGKSNLSLEDIIAAKDCTKAWFDVPGHGLYLESIQYPPGLLLPIN